MQLGLNRWLLAAEKLDVPYPGFSVGLLIQCASTETVITPVTGFKVMEMVTDTKSPQILPKAPIKGSPHVQSDGSPEPL